MDDDQQQQGALTSNHGHENERGSDCADNRPEGIGCCHGAGVLSG